MADWHHEVDVAVVGGGACGLTTALLAARNPGLVIEVFEDSPAIASNTQLSPAVLAAAGTTFQREAGIGDSVEQHVLDILAKNQGNCDRDVLTALCAVAPRYIEWLTDEVKYPLRLATGLARVGVSNPRMHVHRDGQGGLALVSALREKTAEHPNILRSERRGQGLIFGEGRVEGVWADVDQERVAVRAGAVVLACGGFGGNASLVAQYIPTMTTAMYVGSVGNVGDALRWTEEAGADRQHLHAYQGHGLVVAEHGTSLDPGITLLGGVIVGGDGRRFVREDQGYSELAAHVVASPTGRAVAIWDARIQQRVQDSVEMTESTERGLFTRHASLSDLSRRYRLPEDELSETMLTYGHAATGAQDPLGRKVIPEALEPPYYAAAVTGALYHTQGGLRVDPAGRVLRVDGTAIGNLFAGGGAAAGVSGNSSSGYLSGNGFLSALGFGFLIGRRLSGGHGL